MLGIFSIFVMSITMEGDKVLQGTFVEFSIFYACIDYGLKFLS